MPFAILNQTLVVDRYYVIDNHGTDQTEDFLREEGILNNPVIRYVYLSENIGGAGGFFTGLKMAYDDGYDYIWGQVLYHHSLLSTPNSPRKIAFQPFPHFRPLPYIQQEK